MMHIAIAGVLENWAFMGVCCLSALMPFDGKKIQTGYMPKIPLHQAMERCLFF
jgi:hypothetical protein